MTPSPSTVPAGDAGGPMPRRRARRGPWPLVAGGLVGLEALVALVLAVVSLVDLARGQVAAARNLLLLVALLAVVVAGLAVLARALLAGRRGARSPSLTWHLVLLPVASSVWSAGRRPLALLIAVVAVAAGVASVLATTREPADRAG